MVPSVPTVAAVVLLLFAYWSQAGKIHDERVQMYQAQTDYDRSLESLPFPY
jgi:hypothetical protein